ncbi:hypothetical protein C8244_00115 [Paracidovorax avenae]|uniref:hypothetical protein n=1 Tax=Paracidovorax avenae TaxID=80867 RepID=UPI000D15734E|nr:hypothetical protein [Paracidovorax avenae]AVS79666.1 hypothetical protein C8237_00115 [Paracidovorax avenae]AVT18158.1 hypothetical protein C8244_00115 [Paracidovorax avenae]
MSQAPRSTDQQGADPTASARVPQRVERRIDTTQKHPAPDAEQQNLNSPEARLPHERDQAVDMTDGHPDPEMKQAHDDLERGLKDTDRGVPAHEAYQKQKR